MKSSNVYLEFHSASPLLLVLKLIMITYYVPVGVESTFSRKKGLFLSTSSGGKIAIDRTLLEIWQEANGHSLEEIATHFSSTMYRPEQILAALACLTEAGLLARRGYYLDSETWDGSQKPPSCSSNREATVSAIIVNQNSRLWLIKCLSSLMAQSHLPHEVIVVDNASSDGSADWIAEAFPSIRLVSLNQAQSLAKAINLGIETARGEYCLVLNPDVELEVDALAQMVIVAQGDTSCAAVAAKLLFTWAPAFLNGLGNLVGKLSWGTDCALGHLDLGQFDHWGQLPSACFAATLIPASMLEEIGPVDERFPLYYEDSEWCYRARLLGYSILAAPQAVVYHAFSRRIPDVPETRIPTAKLYQVSYGRLRFATKLLGWKYWIQFLFNYFLEDLCRTSIALMQGRWDSARAFLKAWSNYFRSLAPSIRERREIQARRTRSDDDLLSLQRNAPMPLIRHGFPCLTWDIVCHQYLPLITAERTRKIPEFNRNTHHETLYVVSSCTEPLYKRAIRIWRLEGFLSMLYWTARILQWHLVQP